MNNQNIIKNLFSEIRKNNLNGFLSIVSQNPSIINFKNKKKENILFYAYEKNANQICDYINKTNPLMIKEKNILGLNILDYLVSKDKNIDLFLNDIKSWSDSEKLELYKSQDPNGDNVLFFSIKYSNIKTLKKLIDFCPNFNQIQKHQNEYGQNIAHLIALYIEEDISDIIKNLDPSLLSKEDFISGTTPLMNAAGKQKVRNFQKFFEVMPKNQVSYLNNHLIHLASANDIEVINFLIYNHLHTNVQNVLNQSPLFIALNRGKIDIAKMLFEESKKEIIYSEDLIASLKYLSKDSDFVFSVLNNRSNQPIKTEQYQQFLESLFLYSNINDIEKVLSLQNYKHIYEHRNFDTLFYKSISGRKDMAKKAVFLLKDKEYLNLKESIAVAYSLKNLPKNQLLSVINNSNLIKKVKTEHLSLFLAVFLEKNIEFSFLGIEKNNNPTVQSFVKNSLRNTKVDLQANLKNIKNWLSIIKDEDIVFNYFGKKLALIENPSKFIEEHCIHFDKTQKNKLIYYTITSLIREDQKLSKENELFILENSNLLINIINGIFIHNKIPKNKEITSLIKDKNFISEDILISFLSLCKDKEEAANFVVTNLDFFEINLTESMNNKLIKTLGNHEFGHKVFEALLKSQPEKEHLLISTYLDLVGKQSIEKFNDKFINKRTLKHKKTIKAIEENFIQIIEINDSINTEFMHQLWNISNISSSEINLFINDMFAKGKYKQCVNLQESIKKNFITKSINLKEINWVSINNSYLTDKEQLNNFFEFITNNQKYLTNKQINDLIIGFSESIQENNISYALSKKLFESLSNNISKVEVENISTLCNTILTKYGESDYFSKTFSEDSFHDFFDSNIQQLSIETLKSLNKNAYFSNLSDEVKVTIQKEILDNDLSVNINLNAFTSRKKIKI